MVDMGSMCKREKFPNGLANGTVGHQSLNKSCEATVLAFLTVHMQIKTTILDVGLTYALVRESSLVIIQRGRRGGVELWCLCLPDLAYLAVR